MKKLEGLLESKELVGKNFLFAKHKILESAGVVQYCAYVVNPTIKKVVKAIYFPEYGDLHFYAKDDERPKLFELVYMGPAIPEFIEALKDDASPSEELPRVSYSFCCMEEYGIGRATGAAAEKVMLPVELAHMSPIKSFMYQRPMEQDEKLKSQASKAGGVYSLVFANGVAITVRIYTTRPEAALKETSFDDHDIVVDDVRIPLDVEDYFKHIRLYRDAMFVLEDLE